MKKVVAIGELLIDFVPQQRGCALDEVVQFERVAGGAPANVATAVARLGGRAQMISQVGEDAFGTHILKTLRANGVRLFHPATEPVSAAEVYHFIKGGTFANELAKPPFDYDYRTRHAALFGGENGYLLGKKQVLDDVAAFVRAAERGENA